MKEIWDKIWKYLVALAIGIFIGFMINIPSCNKVEPNIIKVPVHDTVKVDSIRIEQNTKIKYITTVDTFYIVQKQDTIYLKDFPIEYKTYNDTIKTDSSNTIIDLNYHGFNAGIDNLSIQNEYFNKNTIIQKQPKRFGIDFVIGPQVGYGYGFKGASPYIGIGATIGFSYRLTK